MRTQLNYFCYNAIKNCLPMAYDITCPAIPGSQKSVYFVKTDFGDYVCKFNHRNLAQKNMIVSNILTMSGVNVPHVCAHRYKNMWLESYELIPGQTLYEYIGTGAPVDKIHQVYNDILVEFAKMSTMDFSLLHSLSYKYTHQVAKTNVTDTNNPVLGNLVGLGVRLVNICRKKNCSLYHAGITPKNIIVSNDGDFMGLVDIDEVALCNKNYAFAMMAAKYYQLGLDTSELIDAYEKISGDKLNHKKIAYLIKLLNAGKAKLWANAAKSHNR